MHNKPKIFFFLFTLFLVLFAMALPRVKAQIGTTVSADTNTFFGFSNGWFNFKNTMIFTTIYETSGDYWYFDNVGISLVNVNATANSWLSNNQIVLNLTSISGTATVLMDISALNPSISVQGATAYSITSGILTITETSFTNTLITISVSPIIVENIAVSTFNLAQNVPFYLNATVYDELGIVSLTSFTLEFSSEYQIEVSWNLGAFTIPSGSSNCILSASGSSVTQTDTYTYIFSFSLELTGSSPEDAIPVLSSGTLASDNYGNTATTSLSNVATYSVPSGPGPGPSNPIIPTQPPPGPENQTTPTNPANNTSPGNAYTPPSNPVFPIIPPIYAQIPFSPEYLLIGIVFIFSVVGVTGYYSGKRKNPLKDAKREWEKQRDNKSPKWNKDD
jgi:hypothetical protein